MLGGCLGGGATEGELKEMAGTTTVEPSWVEPAKVKGTCVMPDGTCGRRIDHHYHRYHYDYDYHDYHHHRINII